MTWRSGEALRATSSMSRRCAVSRTSTSGPARIGYGDPVASHLRLLPGAVSPQRRPRPVGAAGQTPVGNGVVYLRYLTQSRPCRRKRTVASLRRSNPAAASQVTNNRCQKRQSRRYERVCNGRRAKVIHNAGALGAQNKAMTPPGHASRAGGSTFRWTTGRSIGQIPGAAQVASFIG